MKAQMRAWLLSFAAHALFLVAWQVGNGGMFVPDGQSAGRASPFALAWKRLDGVSFQAPFPAQNDDLKVGTYRWSGDTEVTKHFVRLTPDRQSKRGGLWSSEPIMADDWSVSLEFRVSGQGRSLFGDGLAFWFTDYGSYRNGELFGMVDNFNGFAVIFDTFRNTEAGTNHKDVSVLVGKGEGVSVLDQRNVERAGCDANVRYYEKASGFNVAASVSYAKITLKDRVLRVSVDERGDGNFKDCFSAQNVLPVDFNIKSGFIGLTAATGQLADNHDVMELLAYELSSGDSEAPDPELHHSKRSEESLPSHELPSSSNYDSDAALRAKVDRSTAKSSALIDDLKQEMDHKLAGVRDELKKLIGKLEGREDASEGRLSEIEKKVADSIKESIGDDLRRKVREIQDTITGKIDRRLRDLEDRFDIKHSTLQLEAVQTARKHAAEAKDQTLKEIASQGGGWFWPFFILFLIVTCGGGLMFRHFKRLHEKSHLF